MFRTPVFMHHQLLKHVSPQNVFFPVKVTLILITNEPGMDLEWIWFWTLTLQLSLVT